MTVRVEVIVKKIGKKHPGDNHSLRSKFCSAVISTNDSNLKDFFKNPQENPKGKYFFIATYACDKSFMEYPTVSDFYENLTFNHLEEKGIAKIKAKAKEDNFYSRGSFAIVDSRIKQIPFEEER